MINLYYLLVMAYILFTISDNMFSFVIMKVSELNDEAAANDESQAQPG
jgi:hypothetical protein